MPGCTRSPDYRRRAKAKLLHRVQECSDIALQVCSVPGCSRTPEARTSEGLSQTLCRYHRQFRARHGCAWKRSYSGPALVPYIRAATIFIAAHREDYHVSHAIAAIANTLDTAGPVQRVTDLPRLNPNIKARDSLARLRERRVPPERIVAVALGVLAAIKEDPVKPSGHLFPRVQIAKALRRRASGQHIVYGPGSAWHSYPRSAGRVLVTLGAMIERVCEFVKEHHLSAILALKVARNGPLQPTTAAFPVPAPKQP